MAKVSCETIIQQKIAELNQQITHFEKSICVAKQHIATLQQSLTALASDPFDSAIKEHIKSQSKVKAKKYNRRPSEMIAKILKLFPNQWLSAREMMFKAFELEGETVNEEDFHAIVTAFSHVLRKLHEKGIVERNISKEGSLVHVFKWRLRKIEQ